MLNYDLARKRRKWLELTQAELAEQVGVEAATLSRWESGEREPRSGDLVRWARALGLAPGRMLEDPNPDEPAPDLMEASSG